MEIDIEAMRIFEKKLAYAINIHWSNNNIIINSISTNYCSYRLDIVVGLIITLVQLPNFWNQVAFEKIYCPNDNIIISLKSTNTSLLTWYQDVLQNNNDLILMSIPISPFPKFLTFD